MRAVALARRLAAQIDALVGGERLHYYDAAAPIVATDSIDMSATYRKSRYDKGDGDDYLNIPLDREQYQQFVADLRTLPQHDPKDFELDAAAGKVPYFEGCLPIEEMAARGEDALRFGPLKPVGLRDPRTGQDAVRGRATAQRRRRRQVAEPGRLPNAPDVAGAERSLRQAARSGATPSGCGWA